MKNKLIIILLTTIFLTSCTSPTVSARPTPTMPIDTSTPMPTSVPTITPTPGPVGGSGKMLITLDNEIKEINADGSGSQTIFAKEKFENDFVPATRKGEDPSWTPILSPDGKKIFVVTASCQPGGLCGGYKFYLHNLESGQTNIFQLTAGGVEKWSPDSSQILILSPSREMFAINADADFGKRTTFPNAAAAFWSSNGKLLYYYDQGWFTVQSDGNGAQPLQCALCSAVADPSLFTIDEAPNSQRIAIGTGTGTVIIANPDNLNQFKMASLDGYVRQLRWSPDSQKLVVNVDNSASKNDVVILDVNGSIIEKLSRPDNMNFLRACGWSSDSTQIDFFAFFTTSFGPATGYDLSIHTLGNPLTFKLLSVGGHSSQTCPIWLSN